MSTLVYINSTNGVSKSALEVVTYAKKLGNDVIAITVGGADDSSLGALGEYGASKVLVDRAVTSDDAQQLTRVITTAVESTGADTVIFSHDLVAKAVASRLSVRLKAGLVSGAVDVPSGDTVKVNVFSGKAFGNVKLSSGKKIISLLPNSFQPEGGGSACSVEDFNGNAGEASITVLGTKKPEGDIPLPEAELVVSAGRGLKGPENWGMVEDLATSLGAATACSRPVADIGWRPHHEHVGQTGVAIRPNLYIAAGISGAIQHLAGVNGSKVIVVVNTDPEAPFFKAADYGIVGDAFEVLPRLNEAVKKFKASN
ncbi:MAG: electron transfer flavoprotein subunit alpha/FixB family protein [Crocinitomicaceae bacterium]|jgi:electron transfer flavoprotein alpha subunit|nr:electron transfer flavoprotein subunit alpha/FixB family protein [Crocinitomicaceae bacterium]MDG1659142.1 electron transfer flavoprotein subunit alpha/FixB family protein [Crocinitomicaceae bacterium]|tara:strand:+ start:8801 stop:9739 length:939 start_codon:yes stop_codon:yes gene_type:complete